jgi:hypothetical protein
MIFRMIVVAEEFAESCVPAVIGVSLRRDLVVPVQDGFPR